MRHLSAQLREKLNTGATHFCHCWRVVRRDRTQLGLTDHDAMLTFDNMNFHPDAGIHLSAIDMRAGFDAPQPEVMGMMSSPYLRAADMRRGIYDGADYELWLVDWQAPQNRLLLLAGQFGAIRESNNRFHVSLRHVGDGLRENRGRLYQRTCDAVLGDKRCRAVLDSASFHFKTHITAIDGAAVQVRNHATYANDWFAHGVLTHAAGRKFIIRDDQSDGDFRHLSLWQEATGIIESGDEVALSAGCDRRFESCRDKFSNAVNFQGFPDLADDAVLLHVASDD